MRGLPIDDVCERFRACSDAAAHITDSPEPVEGLRLLWRGDIEPARTILTDFLAESPTPAARRSRTRSSG